MEKTIKRFIIALVALVVIGIACFIGYFVKSKANLKHDERSNTACKTNDRLFDYADKLTDDEESELKQQISDLEDLVGMDFVIFIIDDSTDLSDAGVLFIGDSLELAGDLCDYYKFGWENGADAAYNTSVVIVANWDTGDLGYCTNGKATDRINTARAQKIVDHGTKILRNDPMGGLQRMINDTEKAMRSGSGGIKFLSPLICFIVSLAVAIVFFIVNYSKKAGKDTTTASTYSKGNAQILDKRDIFIRKEVHSVQIQSDSGGSGGGGGGGGGRGGASGHF